MKLDLLTVRWRITILLATPPSLYIRARVLRAYKNTDHHTNIILLLWDITFPITLTLRTECRAGTPHGKHVDIIYTQLRAHRRIDHMTIRQ